jgi:hypothetical protein
MTKPTIALMTYLRKLGLDLYDDFLQQAAQTLGQQLIEWETSGQIGVDQYERTTQRNGYCVRRWDTRVGTAVRTIFANPIAKRLANSWWKSCARCSGRLSLLPP